MDGLKISNIMNIECTGESTLSIRRITDKKYNVCSSLSDVVR